MDKVLPAFQVTGRERALLNVLHSVSIWAATRYTPHTPFFANYVLHR